MIKKVKNGTLRIAWSVSLVSSDLTSTLSCKCARQEVNTNNIVSYLTWTSGHEQKEIDNRTVETFDEVRNGPCWFRTQFSVDVTLVISTTICRTDAKSEMSSKQIKKSERHCSHLLSKSCKKLLDVPWLCGKQSVDSRKLWSLTLKFVARTCDKMKTRQISSRVCNS